MENDIFNKILENESKRQKEIIGEFNFTIELSEESIDSNIKLGNVGNVKIVIYPEPTFNKPHVHIQASRNSFPAGDAIVLINECTQWPHANHQTLLNDKQSIDFDNFMKLPYKNDKSITNWDFAVRFWNKYHNDNPVTVDSQPDYTKLYKNIDYTNYKKK